MSRPPALTRACNELWQFIAELAASGTTVLLTAQYLEEADRLADVIVVIDRGIKVAEGTAAQLKAQIGGEVLEACVSTADLDSGRSTSVMPAVPAALSVTTIAFIRRLPMSSSRVVADMIERLGQ